MQPHSVCFCKISGPLAKARARRLACGDFAVDATVAAACDLRIARPASRVFRTTTFRSITIIIIIIIIVIIIMLRADLRGCTANAANSGSAFAKTPRPPPPPPLAPSRTTKKGKHIHPIAHSGATAYPTPHMPQPTRHDRHAQRHQLSLSLSLSVSLPLFLSTAGAAVLGQGSLPLAPTAACPGSASILSVGTTWA